MVGPFLLGQGWLLLPLLTFFPSDFTFIAPWDLYLKTTNNDSLPDGTEQRDNTPKSHGS